MIEIEGLRVERDGTPILHDLSLALPAGGITALIGPNGAGKSTLLLTLAGLIGPAAGQVRLNGDDLHALRPQARALRLAFLGQDQAQVSRLSVREMVGFGRWPHHRGRPGAVDRAAVVEALALFGLGELAGRSVSSLSGGQRQRTQIAMAHAQATPLVLLDEPLSALDPRYAREVMEALVAMAHDPAAPRSVVVVLHDLGMAARYADRVVAMKHGRLTAAGPRREVMRDAMLSELFDTGLKLREVEGADVVLPA
ncbi:ATP-binding cassette domain-containing protein [Limimaricola cinnabarinus]|uniref:ATP-binding cassette domain-containing protein n=1 Tax=Limimaricola cinnabarinus TaxID=1125964 RepID=UPI0024902C1E|nr:ABC transporter ATP-binding protein [Limimaricola cinnabarinus]